MVMKKNILITGVAGLLGSRFADWIIENKKDFNIVGIDNLSGGYIENINKKVKFIKGDLLDLDIDKIFIEYNISYVFHFAAYAAEGLSPFIREFNYKNNLISTTRLINSSIKHEVKRFIFTSTLAVYGHGEGGLFDEKHIPKPIDPYGVAKFACEMDIQIAGEQHGLEWCIIRPHNVYGIKQNIWDKYRNVLGIWMNQNLNGKPLTIFGDGKQTRAFSYIDDSLEPLWNAGFSRSSKNQIINLGGIEEVSILDSAHLLIKIMGSGSLIFLESRHEVKHSIPTYQKSIDLLDFKYKTNIEEGLISMWEWAKKQPKRPQFFWENYELEKGIYSFWKKK
jgi:UDP-glucose 4-epimerase